MGNGLDFLARRSRRGLLALGVLLVLLIGVVDYITGPEIGLSIFYLVPIYIVTWFGKRSAGIILSIVATLSWLVADRLWHIQYSYGVAPYWNAMVRLGIFLCFTVLASAVKKYQQLASHSEEERKVAAAVREREERYRNLVENISEGYYIANGRGILVYCSPNIIYRSGYAESELIGRGFIRFIAPEDRSRVVSHYVEKTADGSIDLRCEFRAYLKDGTRLWVEQSTRIVRDASGAVLEYRNVIRDIAQRKIADEKIRLLASALESASELISITDLDNRFLYVNRAFLQKYGYALEEVLGEAPFMVLASLESLDVTKRIHEQTLQGGFHGELWNRRRDGYEFPIYLSTSRITDPDGTVLGLVGVARDISEFKRAQNALRMAEEKAKRLFHLGVSKVESPAEVELFPNPESISTMDVLADRVDRIVDDMAKKMEQVLLFSSLASHELRTPLTVMLTELESALHTDLSTEEVREVALSTYDEVLRLKKVVSTLLNIASMQVGSFPLNLEKVDFREFLRSFYDDAVLLSRDKSISVVLADGPKAFVMIDTSQMRQVFFNLLNNALRHTPEQGKIRICFDVREGMLILQFSDTGAGIAKEDLPKIFRSFYTSTEGGGDARGVGLGLVLVQRIIEIHGGQISVESEPGAGTTFCIHLPTVPEADT